jgi:LPPG:FO 2-phospho-L-lactate transferase
LGLHLFRSELLRQGVGLAEVTRRIADKLDLKCRLLPMCEQPVSTRLSTEEGELHLQEYLVKRRAEPVLHAVHFDGIEQATPAPGVSEALAEAAMIIIAPSNPLISIAPILAVPGMHRMISEARGLKVAVSPIVGGKSLKGPSDKMLAELGHVVSPVTVAQLYCDFLDVFVVDEQDADCMEEIEAMGLRCVAAPTVMKDLASKQALAAALLTLL